MTSEGGAGQDKQHHASIHPEGRLLPVLCLPDPFQKSKFKK